MARSKSPNRNSIESDSSVGEPRYPYTVVPKSLRRLLELIPQKPKPPKITNATLKTWGFKNSNDQGNLRVLKAVGMLSASGEPTQTYADYMKPGTGAASLGLLIRKCYEQLFQNVTTPEKAMPDELESFFNINSGGSERTIKLQIETFKALAAYATFGERDPLQHDETHDEGSGNFRDSSPTIRIDLHIHLPENKTKAEYDAIFESIANHLYRKRS